MANDEQFALLAVGWAFILVRMFVRWRQVGFSGWALDDYLMPMAGVSASSGWPSSVLDLSIWFTVLPFSF